MNFAGRLVLEMRPLSDDRVNVNLFHGHDNERAKHVDDSVAVEIRMRNAAFGSVAGCERLRVECVAETVTHVLNRPERQKRRCTRLEDPRELGNT